MNERTPLSPDDKIARRIARRNYIVFCGTAALFLFLVVLVLSLMVTG